VLGNSIDGWCEKIITKINKYNTKRKTHGQTISEKWKKD